MARQIQFLLLPWIILHCNLSKIDVVIPCIEKDLPSLELAILGIQENCSQVRRIIVISQKKYTSLAEWFDESFYPFTKEEIAFHLCKEDEIATRKLLQDRDSLCGWYYQQLLKLYAPFVIPGILPNVLILDADTIFLNPVQFLDDDQCGLYNPNEEEWHQPYYDHMAKLLPQLGREDPCYSGITHHMLFQLPVLNELFKKIESFHEKPFWKAFCHCTDPQALEHLAASEYEIYFNFALAYTDLVRIRFLDWLNSGDLELLQEFKKEGRHYASFHAYMRVPP